LVDCLNITFLRPGTTLEEVLSLFGADGWEPLPYGVKRYGKGLVRGPNRIFYDGPERMGIHVSIPGSGCRDLEARGVVGSNPEAWEKFLGVLLEAGAKPSRLDTAVDDFTGLLSLAVIEAAVRSDNYVSRSDGWHFDESGKKGEASGGKTANFGKRASQTIIRIYDKKAEQEAKGKSVELPHWVRVELEKKGNKALQLMRKIAEQGFSAVAASIRSHLEFKEPTANAQATRWPIVEWWDTFLCGIEKLTFSTDPITQTIETVYNYVRRQVAPSLGLIYSLMGSQTLDELIAEGCARWKDKHTRIFTAAMSLRGAT